MGLRMLHDALLVFPAALWGSQSRAVAQKNEVTHQGSSSSSGDLTPALLTSCLCSFSLDPCHLQEPASVMIPDPNLPNP